MSTPVVNPITSIIAFGAGTYFEFQPAASNSPTSWVITGLPSGMSASGTTGLVSGTPDNPGIYLVSLKAHNAEGDSLVVTAPMVVLSGYGLGDPAVIVDVDLQTMAVTRPGAKDGEPVIFGKTGDKILIAVGYVRDSILVPSQVHAIKLALKEFEPDLLIDATTGSFRIVWTDKGPRYLFLIDLTSTAAPQLSGVEGGYEGDFDTHVDLVCEIRTTFEAIVNVGDSASYLPRNSQGFTLSPDAIEHVHTGGLCGPP